MSYDTDLEHMITKGEIARDIKESTFYLRNAFKELFKQGEYDNANLVFVAIDALEIVIEDMSEASEKNAFDDEIKEMLFKAKKSLGKACQKYSKYNDNEQQ